MSASVSVASKNPFDLLDSFGNDIEDLDAPPPPVPREVVKNATTSKKRDEKVTQSEVAADSSSSRGGGRSRGGNESAFRDREAGRQNNLSKNIEDDGAAPQSGRGRGGRSRQYDRHSQTGRVDTDKQVNQGWGAHKGASEWDDELAGEELAQKDAAGVDAQDPNAVPASEAPVTVEDETPQETPGPEQEEVIKTYDEYLVELAQRQADLGPPAEVRRPNEGGSDKKWAAAKELSRKEEEEGDYFVGESKDKTRNRERKTKQILDIEPHFAEPREAGRGGARGGRGRGDRGGRGRGDYGDRSERRGGDYGKWSAGTSVNISDTSAFPSLGA